MLGAAVVHAGACRAGDDGSRRDHHPAHRAFLQLGDRLVDVLPRAVLPELRLGDDDLLGVRRVRARDRLPSRVAGARADRGATADAAGRSAARGAAAAAAPALPVQHAQHHLGADAPRRQRRRRDARAAQRSAAADARSHRHAAGAAEGRTRLPAEIPRDRADAIRRSSDGQHRRRSRSARRAGSESRFSSRSSRTPCATASDRKSVSARWTSRLVRSVAAL